MAALRHDYIVLRRPDYSWAIFRADRIRSVRPYITGSIVDYFHRQDWSYREHEVQECLISIRQSGER